MNQKLEHMKEDLNRLGANQSRSERRKFQDQKESWNWEDKWKHVNFVPEKGNEEQKKEQKINHFSAHNFVDRRGCTGNCAKAPSGTL